MAFVGTGGNYTIETTYKYVGGGAGEYDLAGPQASRWPLCLGGCVLLLAVVIVVLLFFPGMTSTTLKVLAIYEHAEIKDCLLWGDPHVQAFDGSFPSFYDQGEYWIIKSDEVKVQGRFRPTPFTHGLAAMSAISIAVNDASGNPFHVIIDSLAGDITCNGSPVLQGFPSEGGCGPMNLFYNNQGKLVDESQGNLDKRIVHVHFVTAALHLQIMRWDNHLNARITSPKYEGMDGVCGNMNGDAGDDTASAIVARGAGRIADEELLFHERTHPAGTPSKSIADCETEKRQHAIEICRKSTGDVNAVLLNSCIFDVCFGGDQYAEQDGMTIKQVGQK